MDIMVIFCKGLHVLALASITIMFLFRLHGKSPNNVKEFNTQIHRNISSTNMSVSFKKGDIK